ncbi:MAG: hypothetical protein KY476_20545 [Planctomycetes bacterium]|nr:hypothetical protein [Planctomycetota bacterium]
MLRSLVLLLLLLSCSRLDAGELRGGAAAVDITPRKLPVSMTGAFQDRQATAVHDRLHARSLVLDDGRTRIALVICDSCLITRDIYDRGKEIAARETGIPKSHILTAATHTHTAPTAVPLAQCRPDPDYVEHLTQQIAQAVIAAGTRMQPVEVGWGVVGVPEEVGNRRWFVKPELLTANPFGRTDDRVRTNPPAGSDSLIRPAGPVDPDVTFLSMRDTSGRPVALLANYGLHYVGGIPPGELSADYFGEFARQIGERLGGGETFVGMMTNGASGDVNNYQFREPLPPAAPFVRIREVAGRIADRASAAHQQVTFSENVTLRLVEREIELGIRRPDAAELERAKQLLAGTADPDRLTLEELYAQEAVRLSKRPATLRVPLQAIGIGELGIVAIPCEVFAEIGLEIKRKSPFAGTFVIGLANDYHGYLPTPEQHALGGYETWRSGWSYLEPEASTKIVRAAGEMLEAIHDSTAGR